MSAMRRFTGTDVCAEHGQYTFNAIQVGANTVGRGCPECLRHSQEKAEAANAVTDAAWRQKEWAKRLTNAGMPDAFHEARISTYKPTNASASKMLEIVTRYVTFFDGILKERPVSGLVLVGVPGAGKTHIACGVMHGLMESGHSAAYLACPEFLLRAREANFGRSHERLSTLLDRYTRPQFLVVDEFGTHTTNDADYQILFSLIDGRYQRNLPTLLATNMEFDKLKETVDTRLMERIRGVRGPTLAFDWPTHRRPMPASGG